MGGSRVRAWCPVWCWSLLATGTLWGCANLLQLDDYSVAPAAPSDSAEFAGECTSNSECTQRASQLIADAGPAQVVPSVCLRPAQKCAVLPGPDCDEVTGDYRNDRAIVIGSLFATTGSQEAINRAREKSVRLAVEEINMAGGIPSGRTSADGRPLVLVSCDATHLLQAAGHLVDDLQVPAIVGPNTSQDALELSNKLTIASGTIVLSPTAIASSIADLLDDNLTWQMVPSDVQRAPLMLHEIGVLETRLRAERSAKMLKLAIIYRDDALGNGTRSALNALTFNGVGLSDPLNLGAQVHINPYAVNAPDQSNLVAATLRFLPDIVVLVGTAEAVTQIMIPLERDWPAAAKRPEFVVTDSSKTPELLSALTGNPALRQRIRGTGTAPDPRSVSVNEAFMVSYATHYPDEETTLFGMGPAYDATYAVAYGIAALRGSPIDGRSIAASLPRLASGGMEVELKATKVLSAFRALTEGTPLTVIGANAPLRWTDQGAIAGGTIELWCVTQVADKLTYTSSGMTLDLASSEIRGVSTECEL